MIWLYTGTPRSGKSYHIARDIYRVLNRGGNVIANFPINLDLWVDRKGVNRCKGHFLYLENPAPYDLSRCTLSPYFLFKYAQAFFKRDKHNRIIESQCILVFDEAQLIFNSRTWNEAGRREWISFFTQHGKFGYDIVFITQYDRFIDRQVRGLCEYEIKHRNLRNYKIFGRIVARLCGGNLFMALTYWCGVKELEHKEMFRGKKLIYELYDTHEVFK